MKIRRNMRLWRPKATNRSKTANETAGIAFRLMCEGESGGSCRTVCSIAGRREISEVPSLTKISLAEGPDKDLECSYRDLICAGAP
jgi:hypothetical protein